ncbi:MAG: UDP-N-acetylmuramoyl-L-alanine--D-glutamate ligase [Micrococcales bacterium]
MTSWHSEWKQLKVAVIGLGVTGFSVADTLAELGCEVLVVAEKADPEYLDILDVLGVSHVTGLEASGVPERLASFKPNLIVTSPGVKPDAEIILWARDHQIAVWVDVDLAWRLRDKTAKIAKWVTITGTNGKTTTTQLAASMLEAAGNRVAACGNIGVPILDCIRDPEGFDYLVVELSSFQLHYIDTIYPEASALLNIDLDHIDWHGSFEAYAATKGKIYQNTVTAAVYNRRDARAQELLENADVVEGCRAIGFSVGVPGPSDVGYSEDILCDRAFLENRYHEALEVANFEDIALIGVVTPHLLANVAAATALARACGASPQEIRSAIRSFKLDKHRIELVATHNGVSWIDDSKATNPHATNASLESFEHVVWIVGGLLKGVDIAPLVKAHASRLRGAVVIGAERQLVLDALAEHAVGVPVIEISSEENAQVMPKAVLAASNLASIGDTVLLAPASASMDQFKDYADRGNQFAAAVNELIGKQ